MTSADPTAEQGASAKPATGITFNVQRFSTEDGPGIRTTVFMKGCPLRCRWCQNPEALRPEPEIAIYEDRCASNRACLTACTLDALGPTAAGERLDRARCDACGACVAACPRGALELVGRRVTVDGLLEEVLRDAPFYESSGGGLTLSGGEATLQAGFLAAFLPRCTEAGLKVLLQTCGAWRWQTVEPLLEHIDSIQFDLKVMDLRLHQSLTGASNTVILANAERLLNAGAQVTFRMPVVPGLTDTEQNLEGIGAFLLELGVGSISLLPYHRMGEAKLPRLGWPLVPLGVTEQPDMSRVAERLRASGLTVTT